MKRTKKGEYVKAAKVKRTRNQPIYPQERVKQTEEKENGRMRR